MRHAGSLGRAGTRGAAPTGGYETSLRRQDRCITARAHRIRLSGAGFGRCRLCRSGLRLAQERVFQPDPQALTPLQALAFEGGGQPDVAQANIPNRSIAHEVSQVLRTGGHPRQSTRQSQAARARKLQNLIAFAARAGSNAASVRHSKGVRAAWGARRRAPSSFLRPLRSLLDRRSESRNTRPAPQA